MNHIDGDAGQKGIAIDGDVRKKESQPNGGVGQKGISSNNEHTKIRIFGGCEHSPAIPLVLLLAKENRLRNEKQVPCRNATP